MLLISRPGTITAIFIYPSVKPGPMPVGGYEQGNPATSVQEAEVVKGMGLKGDRWFGINALQKSDGSMVDNDHIRNISFFEEEMLLEIQQLGFDVQSADIRRNVFVKGFPLNDLVGKKFQIGNVIFCGTKLCHGCEKIEKSLNIKGVNKVLYMRGGLRAEVLNDGIIKLGDKICCC